MSTVDPTTERPAGAHADGSAAAPERPRRRLGGELRLLAHQIRFEQLSFWRNPQAAFFTFVFPVVIIVIFGALFQGGQESDFFFGMSGMQYYTPVIAALSVLGACFSQLAIILSMRRQNGILKRLRATPLPAWVYFSGTLAHCVMVSFVLVALVIGVGWLYGVPLPVDWPALVACVVLAAACFCALGVAIASLVSNSEAAPAIVQFIQFPLVFLSGSYFPIHSDLLNTIATVLPVRPLNEAMLTAFARGGGVEWQQLGILLAWGVLGTVIAVRRFRWDPKPE
ncbi:ABC transporter permease [Streptomonospora algeriensis]|uniref:Transport permease protein n=1 Tax=Streptomonospora algeriensis TaxID=995084 RepID=A0ABW3BGE3_9ACTN